MPRLISQQTAFIAALACCAACKAPQPSAPSTPPNTPSAKTAPQASPPSLPLPKGHLVALHPIGDRSALAIAQEGVYPRKAHLARADFSGGPSSPPVRWTAPLPGFSGDAERGGRPIRYSDAHIWHNTTTVAVLTASDAHPSSNNVLRFFDLNTGAPQGTLTLGPRNPNTVHNTILTGADDLLLVQDPAERALTAVHIPTRAKRWSFAGHVPMQALRPEQSRLRSGDRILDLATGTPTHTKPLPFSACAIDGALYALDRGRVVRITPTPYSAEPLGDPLPLDVEKSAGAFNTPNPQYRCAQHGDLLVWTIDTPVAKRSDTPITDFAVFATQRNGARVWDLHTGRSQIKPNGFPAPMTGALSRYTPLIQDQRASWLDVISGKRTRMSAPIKPLITATTLRHNGRDVWEFVDPRDVGNTMIVAFNPNQADIHTALSTSATQLLSEHLIHNTTLWLYYDTSIAQLDLTSGALTQLTPKPLPVEDATDYVRGLFKPAP